MFCKLFKYATSQYFVKENYIHILISIDISRGCQALQSWVRCEETYCILHQVNFMELTKLTDLQAIQSYY